MASGDAIFDPTQIAPNWDAQRQALARMYQQGLINLNAKKGNLFAQYGFQNTPDFAQGSGALDFSNLQVDPNQQYGAYRNELTNEANQLDAAQNGPDRGFSGGLANQASAYAKRAVAAQQTGFMQNLQTQLGNLNQEAGQDQFNYNEGNQGITENAQQYAGSQALWQATNPTATPQSVVVPGASGGGSTPLTPQAVQTAASFGYNVIQKPNNLRPVSFTKPPVMGGRGHIT